MAPWVRVRARVRVRVMRHRGAPRATEAHPLVDAERLAQRLEVLQQVRVGG